MADDLNSIVAQQLEDVIIQVHGTIRPFILIMPPYKTDSLMEVQIVSNFDDVEYIRDLFLELREDLKGRTLMVSDQQTN